MDNITQNGKKCPVEREIAKEINQLRDAVRYRARLAGACWASRDQADKCEGDCVTCRYAGIPRVPETSMARYYSMYADYKARRGSIDVSIYCSICRLWTLMATKSVYGSWRGMTRMRLRGR